MTKDEVKKLRMDSPESVSYTHLALPTLIALCSIALGRPTVSTLAVLGEISISGTILKVDELANSLQAVSYTHLVHLYP